MLQLKKWCYRRLHDLPNVAEFVNGKIGIGSRQAEFENYPKVYYSLC